MKRMNARISIAFMAAFLLLADAGAQAKPVPSWLVRRFPRSYRVTTSLMPVLGGFDASKAGGLVFSVYLPLPSDDEQHSVSGLEISRGKARSTSVIRGRRAP